MKTVGVSGRFRAILINKDTGAERVVDLPNDVTAEGLNYIANAVAGNNPNDRLISTNTQLNCSIGSSFTSSGGPVVDGEDHYTAPPIGGVLLIWVDTGSTSYELDSVSLLSGTTVLANTDFPDNTRDKASNELLIIQWSLTISEGAGLSAGAGGAMLAKVGGGSAAWAARVTRFADGVADAEHGSLSVAGAVLTFDQISYANILAGMPTVLDKANAQVNGMQVTLGAVVVLNWLPGNAYVPEPNDGELTWTASITFA